jgi:hypothetical protein
VVVEDEKVSLDELQEQIQEDEQHVQSTDIVSLARFVARLNISDYSRFLGCYAEAVDEVIEMRAVRISISFCQYTNNYGDGTVLVEWNILHDVKQTPVRSTLGLRPCFTPKWLKELVEHLEGMLHCPKCRQIGVKADEERRG